MKVFYLAFLILLLFSGCHNYLVPTQGLKYIEVKDFDSGKLLKKIENPNEIEKIMNVINNSNFNPHALLGRYILFLNYDNGNVEKVFVNGKSFVYRSRVYTSEMKAEEIIKNIIEKPNN